ncbi:DUF3243 domain-containing protein [Paenibacillus protaetiae]|uniref:DUF3243 domain-containing protein n=1 Tax=Paenibacillus protaetiae TaxID=2509456 RepID=A0A4P6ESV0_9BACL|nr:DUF3243 domain-containing protein [Paenibacillus protaetiae]QAY65656.1 DUF3243 domain-containing protein [Paenibacillus protaetiae]
MSTTVLTRFSTWKHFLAERVEQAKKMGMSEDTISNLAFEIGSFLDEKVDPKNDEERLLKEIWDCGDEDERKVISRLMVRLAQKS